MNSNPKTSNPDTSVDISGLLRKNPSYYLVKLHLVPNKSFVTSTGEAGSAPYYATNPSSGGGNISVGGVSFLDGGTVFIPGAPKSTGNPTPGWWPKKADGTTPSADILHPVLYRICEAVDSTTHRFVRGLNPLTQEDVDSLGIDYSQARTWAQAQDNALQSSAV